MSARPRAVQLTTSPLEITSEEAVRRAARVTHLLMRADRRRRSESILLNQAPDSDYRREL